MKVRRTFPDYYNTVVNDETIMEIIFEGSVSMRLLCDNGIDMVRGSEIEDEKQISKAGFQLHILILPSSVITIVVYSTSHRWHNLLLC